MTLDGDAGPRLGAIEAGGTKIVCAVEGGGDTRETTIPTRDPAATIAAILTIFHDGPAIDALGIGSFGPLQLDLAALDYGEITTTPKPGWSGVNLAAAIGGALSVPTMIDTDVNAAALAEAAVAGCADLAYVTVGTGIGVGLISGGRPVHGVAHPEAGHIVVRRHPAHGDYPGCCPYHGDCLEGLASGTAIRDAWGAPLSGLPAGHVATAVEADYLGQLCSMLFLTLAPERIVLGGGVSQHPGLIAAVRTQALRRLGGYWGVATDLPAITTRIVTPASLRQPGLAGALLLARRAFDQTGGGTA